MLRRVVVGTGRCGTGYLSRMVSRYVGPCGHEEIFNPSVGEGNVDARLEETGLVADSSWLAVPWLGRLVGKGVRVFHLVRNPLDVVNSFLDRDFWREVRESGDELGYGAYAARHVPELRSLSDVDAGVLWYVEWNGRILEHEGSEGYVRMRLEDMPGAFFSAFGMEKAECWISPVNEGGCRRLVGVEDLRGSRFYGDLVEMAGRLGY